MIRIAITGSTGFIASAIYKKLKNFFLFTLFSRTKRAGLTHIKKYSDVKKKFDFLLYLSEEANSNIVNTLDKKEITKNQTVLKKLSRRFKNKLIYFSSAAIYSDKEKKKIKETNQTFPKTNYSKNKIICERIVKKNNGIILRLTNILGKKMPSRNIVTTVMSQLSKNNQKYVVIHNKFPIRDFLHIDDLVSLIKKIILNPVSGTFNVGSGVGLKIEKLAKEIINYKKKNYTKLISENKHYYFSKKVLDISKVKSTYKWKPKIKILQNLSKIS